MFKSNFTFKKFVSLLLAVTFVLSIAVLMSSCNNGGDEGTAAGTTDPAGSSPVEEEKPERTDVNFDGYDFKILISNRATNTPNDFDASKDPDSAMGMAIAKRNVAMEEKYGVKIGLVDTDFSTTHKAIEKIEKQYSSQTNDYDMGVINTYSVAPLTTNGQLYDLNTIPYLDLSHSWWDQTVVEDLTIQDSIYYVCGDITTTVDDFMYCVIFNKEMYKQHVTDGTNVYDLVAQGKWTLDELLRLSKKVAIDDNGDGAMDSRDKFGLLTWYDELYASVQAAGGRVAQVNDKGEIELCLYNSRNLDVISKYMELETAASTINFQNTPKMVEGAKWSTMFTNNQAMFLMYTLNKVSLLRDMETPYGILPNPKFNEEQDRWYCTFSAGLAAFVCVPGYQDDIERTGTIIELFGYEATDTVKDGYYEKTLKGTHVRDDESIDSLSVILDNKFVDVGHYYRVGGLNNALYNVAKSGAAGSFASEYEKCRPVAEQDIKEINEMFASLKTKN